MIELKTSSASQTHDVAAILGKLLQDGDVVTLVGDLGAGKTQFSQGVARGLGIGIDIPSPTFNLVFEYDDGRIPLYHFDLYRLDDALELEDIDFHALVDSYTPGISLIEWADKFIEEMPEDRLDISLFYAGESSEAHADGSLGVEDGDMRIIEATPKGKRAEELLEAWLQNLADEGFQTQASSEASQIV